MKKLIGIISALVLVFSANMALGKKPVPTPSEPTNLENVVIVSGTMVELSHGGGTDKCGCHYNRKTGEYHCHTRKKRGGDCPA